MSAQTDATSSSRWKTFWERGGWWKAVLLVVVYYVLYQLGGLLFVPLKEGLEPGSAGTVIVDFALPIAFGGVLLIVFALSLS